MKTENLLTEDVNRSANAAANPFDLFMSNISGFLETKKQLNQEQREAVEHVDGPLLVLAGAGSGKTRVVTYRIANLLYHRVPPSQILGLTFTNKAAEEMKRRVSELTDAQVVVCTFHSLGVRILRESISLLGYQKNFIIYDEQDCDKLMKSCLTSIGNGNLDPKTCLQLISRAKNRLLSPEELDEELSEERGFSEIYGYYQAKMQEYNAVDFDDLLYLTARLFKEYPEAADLYRSRWSYVLIDEYQDTNDNQYAIAKELVKEHKNLFAVGDPDQSIYSWRGANIQNILNFENDYPGAKMIRLEQNYRSKATILEASNALISRNGRRYEKNLWSERGAGEKIQVFVADTEKGEAEFIAEKIQHHYQKESVDLSQMAILYRTNAQSRALEDRLLIHRIPYVIVGGISFYQRREIKDILAFLRLIHSPNDFIAFTRTINLPKRGIGETTIEKIRMAAYDNRLSLLACCQKLGEGQLPNPIRLSSKQKESLGSYTALIRELHELSKNVSLKDLVQATIERSGYLSYIQEEKESMQDRRENLNALIAKAYEWELSALIPNPSLEAFLEELALKSSLDEADMRQDKIRLMTIHNAKGLEFPVVFLAGMEEGLFPHMNSKDDEAAVEEERRLCYVGMTRAKDLLYLTHVRQRFLWGVTRNQNSSRFLHEIPHKYLQKIMPRFQQADYVPKQEAPAVPMPMKSRGNFEEETLEELSEGQIVFHHTFGIGNLVEVYQGSAGLTYKILFTSDGRERSLIAKHAHLKKL